MLKNGILRASIPFIIMTIISIIMKSQGFNMYQVKSTFIVGIIISIVVGASVIYEVRQWTLLKQTIVHFIFMLITVYPCLLISGWFELNTFLDYFKVLALFIMVGIVLWTILYFIFGYFIPKKTK
ncbi:MAG: DUF3021 family protein [Lagierella massiliensis]|nr:DUF3021 family protein [Lagierella massiliensis]